MVVLGTGALIRLATEDEVRALRRTRRGHDFLLEPERSYRVTRPDARNELDSVVVVGQAFVDFEDPTGNQRWVGAEHHGHRVPRSRDATLELLNFADEVVGEGLVDLLGDMGIAGLAVSRWDLMSAPRRIDLDPKLEAQLVPLRCS
ncbi:hypothetical protein [Solirubrobacter soli]|uniref:hypothetical protein n=1 Tax=Solirubrobacter soli TaxID=363832 RepID=UPI000410D41F|nr:hypothetical protein [Solirubrobacter soli]